MPVFNVASPEIALLFRSVLPTLDETKQLQNAVKGRSKDSDIHAANLKALTKAEQFMYVQLFAHVDSFVLLCFRSTNIHFVVINPTVGSLWNSTFNNHPTHRFFFLTTTYTTPTYTTPTHDFHTRPTRYTLSTVRVGAAKAEGMIFITELPDAIATLNQRLMAVIHACDTIMQCDALVIVLR